ncbi:MAG: helix-hairpin-helix domain-containing protein [Chlorobi bacterium]|nr:helix-hairpin-helix domain-containing protein [Chlorobiota bacterium]
MKSLCKIAGVILFISIARPVFAQENTSENQQAIESIIEEIANSTDEELDYTNLYDDLYFYYNNPLNLNTATEEDLGKLQFLNDFQIKNILNYVHQNGAFLSIYELQLLYGFTREDLNFLLPFVTVGTQEETGTFSLKKALKYGNNELFVRGQNILENQSGYSYISDSAYEQSPNSRYLGNPIKYYVKYKYNYRKNLSWGLTMEKDPGEEFFTGTEKYGFDYYSGYVQLRDISKIKTLVVGDYQLKFGQGLTVWSGIGSGKSSYVMNVKKKGQGLSKYSSTDENKFFRGVASTINLGDFDVTIYFSHKAVDANIDSLNSNNTVYSITSLQNSGYHATPAEIFDKDAIDETVFGGNITFTKKSFKTGITYFDYSLNALSNKEITPFNQNEKNLAKYRNVGLNYQYYYRNFDLFGEIASNENFDFASLNGILINLTNQVFISAVYRYFQNNYYSYYGAAFAENSKIVNEKGLYYGAEIYPYKNWKLSVYFDSYEFPYLKKSANAPSFGTDYFVQADYSPAHTVNMYLRFKNELKKIKGDAEGDNLIPPLIDQRNLKLRYHLSYAVTDRLRLKNRIEFAFYNETNLPDDKGYVIYQDINYSFKNQPVNLSFRYAVFDTDSYNSRIYTYENDVLYAFSIPAYYDKGTRTYLTIKYQIFNGFDLWLRIAQTYYSNKTTIGSGLNEISGKTKTEAKVQIRYKF